MARKSKIRFGLVGCGRISHKHLEALEQIPEAELVAVCDVVEEKARSVAQNYKVRYYTDYIDMFEKERFDAVNICTPSGLHPVIGIEAAKRGINVITEKPMAVRLTDADKLINACRENGVGLFVVMQNRLNPPIQLLRRAVEKGRFGRIFLARTTVYWNRTQEYYDMADWRGTWELDGGVLLNQASHYVDLIQWLLGRPKSVVAMTDTLNHNIETEDTAMAVIEFESGAYGIIEATTCTFPKNLEGSITILGETGTAKIGGIAVNKVEVWNFKDYDDDDKYIELNSIEVPNVYGIGHLGYLRNVVDTLLGRAEAHIDGEEGRKSLELIWAIYEAANTGRRVYLK